MSKAGQLRERIEPPEEIIQAALNGKLVLFIGAGASIIHGLPSWKGLAACAFEELRKNNLLNYSEIDQLTTLDPKKQLSIATLIADENSFKIDFKQFLTDKKEGNNIYDSLNKIGCPCVTTNYDELLSPCFNETKNGATTPIQVKRISDRDKLYLKYMNEPGTVIHLHGKISEQDKMIITTKQYLEHYEHENVHEFLQELFAKKTILFIGYGLEEAEILEHILRTGSAKDIKEKRRFALQGFFLSQQPLYQNLYNYYNKSFGVHLIGFIRDHEDYNCLASNIKDWANKIEVRKPPLFDDVEHINEVLSE